jgi:hypothetical protein
MKGFSMKNVLRRVDSVFSEIRTYDDDGKLVEVRKVAMEYAKARPTTRVPKGTLGGSGSD